MLASLRASTVASARLRMLRRPLPVATFTFLSSSSSSTPAPALPPKPRRNPAEPYEPVCTRPLSAFFRPEI
jgi:hypothetical protein